MSQRKYPKAIAGRVPLFHPAMKPFQSLPWIRISPWYQFVGIGVFIAIILLSIAVMEVGHWETGLAGFIVVVISLTVALPTCYQIVMRRKANAMSASPTVTIPGCFAKTQVGTVAFSGSKQTWPLRR
jgi:hypothetical protein